jgi:hypothetical protein
MRGTHRLLTGQSCCPVSVWAGALCREKGSIKTIAKKSYGRGAGTLMHCAAGLQEDAGLCYHPCPGSSYSGVGPVCWDGCPASNPVNGGALCCTSTSVCTKKIIDLSTNLPEAVLKDVLSGGDPLTVIQVGDRRHDRANLTWAE